MKTGEPFTLSRFRQSVECQLHKACSALTRAIRDADSDERLRVEGSIESLRHVRSLLIQAERLSSR